MSTLTGSLALANGKQTNTEITHLHFKAIVVHFLPDLQFGGATSDVNKFFVHVVDVVDRVRVGVDEGARRGGGEGTRGGDCSGGGSLARSLTRVVCSGNDGERAN